MIGTSKSLFKSSLLVLMVLGVCSAQQEFCRVKEVFPGTCDVQCTRIGVNGNTEHPGHVAAQFLIDVYPAFKDLCVDAWVLKVSESSFPADTLDKDWLSAEGEMPPVSSVIIERCNNLSTIQPGAFDTAPALRANLKDLAFYYNPLLNQIVGGTTDGLTDLRTFNWVGNGILQRADSEVVFPFHNTIEILHIGDCGMSSSVVLANMTGYCQSVGSFPRLFTMDLGFNPGPALSVLSSLHLSKLDRVRSLYLWSSEIERFEDTSVFDYVANSITTIDLSNNRISNMRSGMLDNIIAENKQRVLLGLGGNPWHCDCNLQWLQDVIRFALGGIILSDAPLCASPASQAGTLLIEANMTAEECFPLPPDEPISLPCVLN